MGNWGKWGNACTSGVCFSTVAYRNTIGLLGKHGSVLSCSQPHYSTDWKGLDRRVNTNLTRLDQTNTGKITKDKRLLSYKWIQLN